MNEVLWLFAVVLAIVYLITGYLTIFRFEAVKKRITWVNEVPRPLVILISIAEILAALGLVLPGLTCIYPRLVGVAAAGLAVLMFSATSYHLARHDTDEATSTGLLLLMTAFVAVGRLLIAPLCQ